MYSYTFYIGRKVDNSEVIISHNTVCETASKYLPNWNARKQLGCFEGSIEPCTILEVFTEKKQYPLMQTIANKLCHDLSQNTILVRQETAEVAWIDRS